MNIISHTVSHEIKPNAVVLKSCCACHFTVFVFSIIKLSFWILGFTDSASIGEHGSSHYRDLLNSDKHLIVKDFPSTVAFKYVNQRFTLPLTWKGRDRLISFRIESKISLQPSWKKKPFVIMT